MQLSSQIILLSSIPLLVVAYRWFTKAEILLEDKRKKKYSLIFIVVILLAIVLSFMAGTPSFSGLFIALPLAYGFVWRDQIRKFVPANCGFLVMWTVVFFLLYLSEIGPAFDDDGPYFVTHMISYAGFYLGLSGTIVYFLRRYQFVLREVFLIGAFYGAFIEQNFLGITYLITFNIAALVFFLPFVALTYGLYLVGPYLFFHEEISAQAQKSASKISYLLFFIALAVVPLGVWLGWNTLIESFGVNISNLDL